MLKLRKLSLRLQSWTLPVVIIFCFVEAVHAAPLKEAQRQSGKQIGSGEKLAKITLEQPTGGWTVSRMVAVTGEVSDTTVDPITVNINGDRYLMRTASGKFSRKFPVTAGKNTVIVSATNKAGSANESRVIFAKVPTVALMAVLTSDTDGVYTDLHVYEPDPSKTDLNLAPTQHIYWAETHSKSGGQFYLNEQSGSYDQPGYGPYLYTHAAPPLGIYRIDANYWPSGDKAHTVATLNITAFGGTSSEVRKTVKQPLVMPGETATLAYLKISKGQIASIYSPGVDPLPRDTKIWPQWVIDAPARVKTSDGQQ
jgi:uncharacterized protein YfaP (DUF2135 family)